MRSHPPVPLSPYQRWYTDVEPAHEHPAECECHYIPTQNNCLCVTEEDVYNWNSTYSAFSALIDSEIDINALASATQLANSAYLWNQTYDTINSYSGLWNSVSAVSAKTDILADDLVDLSGKFENHKHYVDQETLIGDGTLANPWKVAQNAYSAYEQDYEKLQKSIDELEDSMDSCKTNITTSIAELSAGHSNNFELIMQIMRIMQSTPAGSANSVIWLLNNNMSTTQPSSYDSCTLANTIYFKPYSAE